jgi:hypothetical protein
MDFNTVFPEFSRLRNVAKFLATEAYVAYADGNSASGTDALLVALKMANRLPQDAFISRLVSISMNALVLAEFERRLDQLSSKDVLRVLAALGDSKAWESGLFAAFQSESRAYEITLKALGEGSKTGDIPASPSELGLPEGSDKLFASMKPADWKSFMGTVLDRVSTRMQSALEILKGPEAQWLSELKAQGWKYDPPLAPPPTTLTQAADQFASIFTDIVPQIAGSEARFRTLLRLLRLHMRVLSYKWKESRLPERLDQAAPVEEMRDTFAGGEFQYVPDPFGHYQLYSKGFGVYGRIDLKWRGDPNAPRIDPGDIPPGAFEKGLPEIVAPRRVLRNPVDGQEVALQYQSGACAPQSTLVSTDPFRGHFPTGPAEIGVQVSKRGSP